MKACPAARVAMRPNLMLFLGVLAALALVSGTAPSAKAHAPADRRREAYVDVGVATLWVQPRTNQPIDKPAVSDPSNVRLWRLDEHGTLEPSKVPGKKPKLDQKARTLLEKDLRERPWATHSQRAEFLYATCGVSVSEATICRTLKRLSHSRKKGP